LWEIATENPDLKAKNFLSTSSQTKEIDAYDRIRTKTGPLEPLPDEPEENEESNE